MLPVFESASGFQCSQSNKEVIKTYKIMTYVLAGLTAMLMAFCVFVFNFMESRIINNFNIKKKY